MEAMDPSTYRGKVNRDMVMPAYVRPAPTAPAEKEVDKAAAKRAASALSKVQEEIAKLSMSAADFELYQIDQEFAKIAKEIGAANPLLKQWVDLRREEAEVIRKKSVDKELEDFFSPVDKESVKAQEKNLELIIEFADKYKEVVRGETAFKISQIEEQAEAYRKAGVEEVALAQWASQEKQDIQMRELREQQAHWEAALSQVMENTYNVGNIEAYFRVQEDLLQGQMAMLNVELQMAETEAERAEILAQIEAITQQIKENKAAAAMDAFALAEIGLQRFRSDSYMEQVDFYKNLYPNAINTTSEAMGQFVADMVDGQAKIGDAWEAIKSSIHEAALSIVQDMTTLFLKRGMIEVIGLLTGTSFTGGMTGYGAAPASTFSLGSVMNMGSSMLSVVGMHSGGIAGAESTFSRAIDPSIFSGASRYHTGGLAGDEVPIIAKRGEGVFTEGQMQALGGGGGNSEMTGLLREIAAGIRAQKATKVVNAIGKGAIANELSGSEGEQVIFNHIRRNPQAVRRMLGL